MMKANDASSFLTQEEVQEIEQQVLRSPDVDLTFAQVFAIKQLANPNAESGSYEVADSDEGSARLLRSLSHAEKIFVSAQRVTYAVYTEGIAWELKMSDIESSRAWGVSIDTEVIQRATRKVNEKINSLAYLGDTEFGVTGILEASGVTAISGTTTFDVDKFIGYFNSLPVEFRNKSPYTLVLADQEWKKLQVRGNTFNDKSIAAQLLEAIPNLTIAPPEANLDVGGNLGGGGTLSEGIGLLVPKDQNTCRLAMAQSPRNTQQAYMDVREIKGTVFARTGIVELVFPTAVGKITGLA